MTADERIEGIQRATTYAELRAAMEGYTTEAVEQYPHLAGCAPLRKCLNGGVFVHAIVDLDEWEANTGETYPDARRVLTAAATKHMQFGGGVPLDLPQRN
ncbi:hypothetical protein [Paraburkholderia tropica]|uniref:hypothetical protein n=1 Tax=Paraburkholderia tropica TaxID=92647 RepID=UPI002AB7C063|nr:hypothetical protein [Paraburkholderia tropica]